MHISEITDLKRWKVHFLCYFCCPWTLCYMYTSVLCTSYVCVANVMCKVCCGQLVASAQFLSLILFIPYMGTTLKTIYSMCYMSIYITTTMTFSSASQNFSWRVLVVYVWRSVLRVWGPLLALDSRLVYETWGMNRALAALYKFQEREKRVDEKELQASLYTRKFLTKRDTATEAHFRLK